MNLEEARALMEEWTESPALRIHMECVALCMGACARKLAPHEEEAWAVAGLLHDYDYEKHPTREEHPMVGVENLRRLEVGEAILEAILGHAEHTGTPRESAMSRALFAVDELAGFIVACAKVRPRGILDLEPRSVKKKLKDRAFAAAVSREDIARGIRELAVDETEHLQLLIDAIRAEADRLGLGASG
jgi:predicted hydrolase (HD superfamily)